MTLFIGAFAPLISSVAAQNDPQLKVRYLPREGNAWRMVGGAFEGSHDSQNWTTLGVIDMQRLLENVCFA